MTCNNLERKIHGYLGPVVAGTGLAEHEVVRAEELAEGAGTDGVHGAGLQVHQDGTGHVAAARGLVEVHVDALQLEVGVAVVRARGVHAVLVGDDLPELGADLVAALAALNVHDLSHLVGKREFDRREQWKEGGKEDEFY